MPRTGTEPGRPASGIAPRKGELKRPRDTNPGGEPHAAHNNKQPSSALDKVLLNRDDLRELGVNFHRTYLSVLIRKGLFPQPVVLGGGDAKFARKAWRVEDVQRWLANRQTREAV